MASSPFTLIQSRMQLTLTKESLFAYAVFQSMYLLTDKPPFVLPSIFLFYAPSESFLLSGPHCDAYYKFFLTLSPLPAYTLPAFTLGRHSPSKLPSFVTRSTYTRPAGPAHTWHPLCSPSIFTSHFFRNTMIFPLFSPPHFSRLTSLCSLCLPLYTLIMISPDTLSPKFCIFIAIVTGRLQRSCRPHPHGCLRHL